MKYQAILFDLDGTLLPMDQNKFTKGYFKLLAKAASVHGYTYENLIPAMWKGVLAMVKNDRSKLNRDAFWEVFAGIFGEEVYSHIPTFDAFYSADFHKTKELTEPNPLAKTAVNLAHEKAEKVVLATNPLFPEVAIKARLSFIGLKLEDFDLVTTYDNFGSSKPNPLYYQEIAEKLGLDTKKCLMVGNNAEEDIAAGQAAGLSTYLVTDCLIAEGEIPNTPSGSFADLVDYLKSV